MGIPFESTRSFKGIDDPILSYYSIVACTDKCQILLVAQCLYAVSLCLIKISICFFYNRIFPFHNFRIASWAVMALVTAWAVGIILYTLLSCRPLNRAWDLAIFGATCVHNKVATIVIGVLDVLTNISLVFLPLPLLNRLNLSTTDKICLVGISGTGLW